MATSYANLADVMQRSSATLASAGVSLEQGIGLATGALEILGDKPEQVGRALNSLTQRLRGLTEVGEDGYEGVSKLNKALESVSSKYGKKISIFDNDGNLRSTYEILRDLSEVYPKLTENERQYIGEISAGKTQISSFNAIMTNFEGVVKATDLALNSSGSAMKENEVFQESLQGRVNQLNSAFSELANKSINSSFVSAILQASTAVLKFLTDIGGLPTIILSVAGAFAVLNFSGVINGFASMATALASFVSELIATRSATLALTTATQGSTVAVGALKAVMGGFIALGIMGVIYGISKAFDVLNVTVEEQTEKVNKLQTGYDELQSKINELKGKEDKTVTEERYLTILEQQLEIKKQQLDVERELLALKTVTGKGEWFSDGEAGKLKDTMSKLNEQVRIYNLAVSMAEKTKDDPFQFEAHSNNAQTAKERMIEFASQGVSSYQEIMKYVDALPEKEKASAKALMSDYDALMISLQDYGVGQSEAKTTTEETTESADNLSLALKSIKDELEDLEKLTDDTVSEINNLNDAIAKQANGVSLSAKETDALLKRYPELQGHIETTADGYRIETGVLEGLREQAYNTYQQQIDGSSKSAKQVVTDCQAKIKAIIAEMQALKNLQEMYSSTDRTIMNPSGLDRSLLFPELSNAIESQVQKSKTALEENNKLLADAQTLLNKLETGSARVDLAYDNLGNEIEKVGDKAQKSAKQIKDYADEIKKLGDSIVSAKKQLEDFKKGFDLFKQGYVNDAFREQKLSINELEEGYKSAKAELEKLTAQYNVLKQNTKGDEAKEKLDVLNEKIKEQVSLISQLTEQAKSYNNELKSASLEKMKNERQGLNDILSDTIELIKYEKQLEKEEYEAQLKLIKETNKAEQEALKERVEKEKDSINEKLDALEESVEERKKLIKEESDAQKKALKDELSAYQDIINKRKELLEKEEEEKDYKEKLAEEQAELLEMKQKLQELELAGDTAEGRASYLEQKKKVTEQEKVIADLQHEWNIKTQKETLDQMLKDKQDSINNQVDAVEEAQDEEEKALDKKLEEEKKKLKDQLKYWESYLDAETKKLEDSLAQQEAHYQNYIDQIDKYLKEEGTIRLDAMKEIETNSDSLYKRLIDYNFVYGTGVDKNVTEKWNLATEALRKYANEQGSVLSALGKIDALEDYTNNQDNSVKVDTDDNDKITTEKPKTEAEKLKEERANLQKYYHDQMQIAINTSNEGLKKWIKEQRKQNKFDPDTGADLYKYHTGGIAGKQAGKTTGSLAPNEVLAKLLKGEVTATESQASNFLKKTLPTLIGISGQTISNRGGDTYQLVLNTGGGNVDSSTYTKLRNDMEKMIKALDSNKAMFKKGNVRNARSLSI